VQTLLKNKRNFHDYHRGIGLQSPLVRRFGFSWFNDLDVALFPGELIAAPNSWCYKRELLHNVLDWFIRVGRLAYGETYLQPSASRTA
jgi:hypothetical protein